MKKLIKNYSVISISLNNNLLLRLKTDIKGMNKLLKSKKFKVVKSNGNIKTLNMSRYIEILCYEALKLQAQQDATNIKSIKNENKTT